VDVRKSTCTDQRTSSLKSPKYKSKSLSKERDTGRGRGRGRKRRRGKRYTLESKANVLEVMVGRQEGEQD
jgi:hypothetical protein